MIQKSTYIFILSFLLLFSFTQFAQAQTATLFFSPATATLTLGETIWITVMVDTGGEAVNALAAYFSYPADKLEAVGVNIGGSVMTLFAEQTAANGTVLISGGKPTPGFFGVQKVASVGFTAKSSSGTATLSFNSDAAVLRDSDNQNILNLSNSGQGIFTLSTISAPPPGPPPPGPPPPGPPPPGSPPPGPTLPGDIITDVTIEDIGEDSVVISWKTAEETVSRIEYGTTSDFDNIFLSGGVTTEHRVTLFDLTPETSYLFRVVAKDALGTLHQTDELQFTIESQVVAPAQEEFEEETRFSGIVIGTILLVVLVGIGGTILIVVRGRNE
ncbi:fibronectin type III domain-containing protein [Patescibacteria group bacterium]|nr:fibronectin type III domain-containing protein [Patescibacteria group bacterium]